jgi:RNA polymerase sigma-70 factor (ECF subfamily)
MNPIDISDEPLVRSAKSGHGEAFEELMRRSWDRSSHVALHYLRDRDNALEELQWAYWKAYKHLNTLAEDTKFSTWLGRIVTNQCMQRLRSTRQLKWLSFEQVPGFLDGTHLRDSRRPCSREFASSV